MNLLLNKHYKHKKILLAKKVSIQYSIVVSAVALVLLLALQLVNYQISRLEAKQLEVDNMTANKATLMEKKQQLEIELADLTGEIVGDYIPKTKADEIASQAAIVASSTDPAVTAVSEVTGNADGSTTTTVSNTDGTKTVTTVAADGTQTITAINADGTQSTGTGSAIKAVGEVVIGSITSVVGSMGNEAVASMEDEAVVGTSKLYSTRISDILYDISKSLPAGVSLYEITGGSDIKFKIVSDSITKISYFSKELEVKDYVTSVSMSGVQKMSYSSMTYYATEVTLGLKGGVE